ncbi:MAG: CPBP family intramembrane glutamic endopeptidase [FCB group bacterium]|nr:CPBP family intramembrane glutamic endopeptidase [FCB group bacterium]
MTVSLPEGTWFGILRIVLLMLLALHVLHAVVTNRYHDSPRTKGHLFLSILAQSPLFVVSFLYALGLGAFSRQLVSPLYIGLGLVAGHLIFVLSLLVTHRSLFDAYDFCFDVPSIWNFTVDYPIVLTRFIGVAVGEEIIWRAAAQTEILRRVGNPLLAILIVAVLFSIVHKHFFRNALGVSVEFLAFAVALGALYYWTQSLILVIVIHAVRDIEIAYLEYLVKVEEIGDAELAAQEVERSFFRRHPEKA